MTDCLECPTPDNYAAIALQLQETALQTEACLFDLERLLRSAVNRPTLIRTSTSPVSVVSGFFQPVGFSSTTLTFANTTTTDFVGGFPEGVWHVGANITAIASGAVDDNSYRYLTVRLRNSSDPPSAPDVTGVVTSVREVNNGFGVDMSLTAVIVIRANQELVIDFAHGNTSSNLNISTGAVYWATRISDIVSLQVV